MTDGLGFAMAGRNGVGNAATEASALRGITLGDLFGSFLAGATVAVSPEILVRLTDGLDYAMTFVLVSFGNHDVDPSVVGKANCDAVVDFSVFADG